MCIGATEESESDRLNKVGLALFFIASDRNGCDWVVASEKAERPNHLTSTGIL